MLDLERLVPYLRKSLLLDDPTISTDSAFQYTDEELADVLEMAVYEHNPSYNLENFPKQESTFVILLAKKEIYYRLATISAPFYPLRAEGAELRKDVRFDHYMSLIKLVNSEYATRYEKFTREMPIQQGTLFVATKHYTTDFYNEMEQAGHEVYVDNITHDSVEINWDKFDIIGGRFDNYSIYVSESLIYDKYTNLIEEGATKVVEIRDIHRTFYRITELEPEKEYHILVVFRDTNGFKECNEFTITTLPFVQEEGEIEDDVEVDVDEGVEEIEPDRNR